MLSEVTEFATYLSPIVLGLVQVIKMAKIIDKDFLPLTSVFVGVLLGLMTVGFSWTAVLIGIISALISMGLYDTYKKTFVK